MDLTASDYRQQMQRLLPSGLAWPRALAALLTKLLDAAAQEFARVHGRAFKLVDEADPRTTAELLGEWERVAGLPDNCSGLLSPTMQGRRNDLLSKLTSVGGQSPAYYVAIAKAMGFDVVVEEFRPFRIGSRVGEPLSNGDWVYSWRVRAPEVTVSRFRVGQSAVGEPLATWGNAGMECRIRQYKPAHTRVHFAYGGLPSLLLLPDGKAFLTPQNVGLTVE